MTTTINYPYATPGNYTYDSDKIEVTGGVAKLKLSVEQNDFTEDFTSDSGFTYDSAKAEFSAGLVQQKDQRPANATFASTYTSSIDGSWGGGVLTGTAFGGAAVSGTNLNLAYSDLRYVSYSATSNAQLVQTGCIRFKLTPNYSGSPASTQNFICISKSGSSSNNRIYIRHSSSGLFEASVYSQAGSPLVFIQADWSPVAFTTYEIELNFNITAGVAASRVFINGTQLGSTNSGSGLRDSDIGLLRVGSNISATSTSNFYIEDLVVFNTVQHTANYTPGYTLTETAYVETSVTLPEMAHTGNGSLISFDSFSTTDTNSPRYTLQIGRSGDYLYWDGAAWSVSDGTFAQATDEATFLSHCAAIDIEDEIYGQFKILFTDSNNQQSVDALTATITENGGYPTDNPSIITNSQFITTGIDNIAETSTVTGSDAIKHAINAGGQHRYVTGGSAADSDGTYAQASTAAELNSDIENLVTTRKSCSIKSFLHSDDGSTTPELDLLSIQYNAAALDPTLPTLTELEGFIYDPNQEMTGETVRVRPYLSGFINNQIFHKYEWTTIATTDADGYFFGNIYVQSAGHFWEMKVGSKRYKIELRDQAENYLWDLLTFEVISDD